MPIKSPFHTRTSALCNSMNWKEWAGYYAVNSYQTVQDPEYFAFRNSVGLLDITPLFKYTISGPDAASFLSRIMVRDIQKLKIGCVFYTCWCTEEGKVIDDGTIMRRTQNEYFVTSADPAFSWFSRFTRGYEVSLEDVTDQIAALALQGPYSRALLEKICGIDFENFKFFTTQKTSINGIELQISRTGYTGDLGYELWVKNTNALDLWDHIFKMGRDYALKPVGLAALDITRVEAGLILKDVDFYNALHVLTQERMSTPYELSLGWMVDLDRELFNGQDALEIEKANGSEWSIVGLDINWPQTEKLYKKYGLPPEIGSHSWRASIPVYTHKNKMKQVGYASSGTWSPILKKNIALATLQKKYAIPGSILEIEMTVEHHRYTVSAIVCKTQFYNPQRKTSNPKKEAL